MSKALFVVDDRPEAGRGHVVRSGALRAEIQDRGWECRNLPRDEHNEAAVLIVDRPFRNPLADVIGGRAKTVLVCDGAVSIDGCDLLVNGGAGATPEMYRDSGARQVLAGPKYALLRPEFLENKWSPELCQLNSSRTFDARNVGSHGPYEMAWAMSKHHLTITPSGMRAMEAACVGAPMILFVESDDQEMNAQALQKRCAGVIARDEDYAKKLVKDLLRDPDWLARMSHAGRSLVDGLGTRRVADAIEALV